jgi:A118 family predicted phage portal protein
MIDIKKAIGDRVTQVKKVLKEQGYVIDDQWYSFITLWLIWYTGFDPDFHIYKEADESGNNRQNEIQISSLHMGKTICEDWAALLLGEKTTIEIDHDESNIWLQGDPDDQMQGGLFGDTNFWQRANELVEKSFALGFGAMVPRIKEATVDAATGALKSGTASIDFMTADQIFPLTYENRTIKSCAFVSERAEKDKTIVTIQIHEPGKIQYRYYEATKDGLAITDMGDGYAQEIIFANKKLFLPVFIYPQINNHLDITTPFGISVYATAIDILKGTDLAYDNFNTDIELGRKLVFMSDELLEPDADGNRVAPQKTRKRLFEKVGTKLPGDDSDPFIHEYNPSLRVEENTKAVQAQLDYLSFKCGMGPKFYRFENGTVQTAYEVASSNTPLFRNRQKHNTVIAKALIDLCRNALWLGVELKTPGLDPTTAITVVADDSIVTDTNTEKMQVMQEITAGIRYPWEYRAKFFGESEEDAKKNAPAPAPVASGFNLDDENDPPGGAAAAEDDAAAKGKANIPPKKGQANVEPPAASQTA